MFLTVLFLRKCVDGSCKTFCCFFRYGHGAFLVCLEALFKVSMNSMHISSDASKILKLFSIRTVIDI